MQLRKLILTQNACYRAGRKISVRGIMVHSTGANNPRLSRYVGPDDGLLGKNPYNNHWNTPYPEGREVCVHGFIGRLADGSVATYQTLPWDHRGWHAGGSANDSHIGFEICEDDLSDGAYFALVYREAVELCAHLCRLYGLTAEDIICHSEGYSRGIASNHGDVMHWFPKHGKSMDTLRAEVAALLHSHSFSVGDAVVFDPRAQTYEPTAKPIPDWVRGYVHTVTAVEHRGAPVLRGGKRCVLLGQKRRPGGEPEPGINTWVAVENLRPADRAVYTVKKGDTLWSIAQNRLGAGLRYRELMALNDLRDDTIVPGQQLRLPER